MRTARWILLALFVTAVGGFSWAYSDTVDFGLGPTVLRFKLEASFTFDGQPYTAIGYMECSYRRAWFTSGSNPYRLGEPIYQGYYTSTFRDAPSVVLPDGKAAILIQHGGSCPPLPVVRTTIAENPASESGASWPAYYFPDRNDPKVIWVFRDRRPAHASPGRFVLKHYLFVSVKDPVPASIAQNVPIAWRWYERMSTQSRSGRFDQRMEDVWFGVIACLMDESEWRMQPDFVRAASGVATTTLVSMNEPGRDWARNCHGQHTPQISLVPSDDYSKATLDLDRNDLRWAAITTPYIPEYRDRETGRWMPELCIAGEGCTGIRMRTPYWVYLAGRRAFARIDEAGLETFRFPYFALRPGDGL